VRGVSEFTSKAYFDSLGEGKIRASKCEGCGAIHLPPRPVCLECGSDRMGWVELEGEGEITAYTVIAVPLSRMVGKSPYTVAVVKLDSGPSVSGQVLVGEGDEVSVGTRVVAEFVEEGEATSLCFRPA